MIFRRRHQQKKKIIIISKEKETTLSTSARLDGRFRGFDNNIIYQRTECLTIDDWNIALFLIANNYY